MITMIKSFRIWTNWSVDTGNWNWGAPLIQHSEADGLPEATALGLPNRKWSSSETSTHIGYNIKLVNKTVVK